MTYIAKSIIQDNAILNEVARDLLSKDESTGEVRLRRGFKIVTNDGVIHELTFAQLDGLINILDTGREVPPITPLQYLVTNYDLEDLVELGRQEWLVPNYTIIVMHDAKTVRLDGTLSKHGHVDKEFTYALGDFDFVQQFSLSRSIANQSPQLAHVIGTYDFSYEYSFYDGGISIKPLEIKTE